MHKQQAALGLTIVALERAFFPDEPPRTLSKLRVAFAKVLDGVSAELLTPVKKSRRRTTPERQMDAIAVTFVRLYSNTGMGIGEAIDHVARMLGAAGMTTHGGGRQADSDNAGINHLITSGSLRSLWQQSQKHGRSEKSVGSRADLLLQRYRELKMSTRTDVDLVFEEACKHVREIFAQ